MTSDTHSISRRLAWGLVLLASLLLGGCDAIRSVFQPEPQETPAPVQVVSRVVIAEGQVVPLESSNLFFTVSGEVLEVRVEEGDPVRKGDVLARLDDRAAYQASLALAEFELVSAQQGLADLDETADLASSRANLALLEAENALRTAQEGLEELDTDEYQDRIDDARQAVTDVEDELEEAQDEFDKYKELAEDNLSRKNAEDRLETAQDRYNQEVRKRDQLIRDLEQAREIVDNAQATLEQARRDADARRAGPDPDQLSLAEARLKNAQAQVDAAQAALDRLDLRAPYDGTVVKVELATGERVLLNQTVIVVADFSAWYVETTDLTENEVVRISQGQRVTLLPDALPEVALKGTVESISQVFAERAGDVTYLTRISIEEPDPLLRWGMTVEVRFEE